MRKFLFLLGLFSFFVILFFSCRKTELKPEEAQQESSLESRFFLVPATSSPEAKAVAGTVKRQNEKYHFLSSVIKRAGYPRWDKAKLVDYEKGRVSNRGASSDSIGGQTLLIPFVLDSGNITNAVLAVRLNESDTSFRFLYATGYRQFGYDTTDHTKWNARNAFHLFTSFDYSLFGHTRFRIRDSKLFKAPKDSMQVVLTLKPREGGRLGSGRQALLQVTECTDYMVCYIYTGGDGGGMVRTTGNPYYYEDECQLYTLCTTYNILGGGSGGDGGTGTGPGPGGNPGSGGSGGSGGEWGGGNPCGGNAARTNREAPGGDCRPGWEPVPSDRDANGFLYSRINELKDKIAANPYELLPCDEIAPLDDVNGPFGNMYKRIAQYTLPQAILDRIDQLENSTTWSLTDDFYIQELDAASGNIVNCDFYGVRILQLPTGWTAAQLLEHFRTNINSFINDPTTTNFTPYNHNAINDNSLFNAPYTNSLGALVSILLGSVAGLEEKGSVILSEYYQNFVPNQEHHRFKFTTMATPLDWNHPVSGHREFGIYNPQNSPNEFCFYIMGVDRASGPAFAFLDNTIFQRGDELWRGVRDNMITFIQNLPGGQATSYANGTVTARPKWADVREYLRGDIDYATLKQRLGC